MPDVAAPPRPALVVIPNVELAEVGMEWQASTGPLTLTPDDLAAAVAALDDPAVHSPILRFAVNQPGHQSPAMFAFGRVTNLRTSNDGMTLVGDIVGAPAWLAEVLPYAWPFRSIEGIQNETTATGRTHLLRMTALALLGVELPAISTLEDVAAVYSASSMAEANVTLSAVAASSRGGPLPDPVRIAAATTTEDVRRAYYDQLGPEEWAFWIRELVLDPLALIVTDDRDGSLWRVPVSISGDEVTFGTSEAVRVEYVAASASDPTSATPAGTRSIVFANRAESRPDSTGEPMPDLSALRQALGLGDDASEEDVLAAAATAATERTTLQTRVTELEATPPADPPPAPPAQNPPAIPDGAVLIDAARLAELEANAAMGVAAAQRQRQDDEDRFIARHRAQGRLAPTTNTAGQRLEASLRREWQRNPGEAEAIAASLAIVAPTAAVGHEDGAESTGEDAIYASLFGGEG